MPEPEAAVDVAMIRAALEEAATNADRGIGGSQYAVLGHYTLPKVLAALERSTARAERLAELLNDVAYSWDPAMFVVVCRFCGGASPGGTTKPGHAPECALARAALAGDAPGRGEDT